MENKRSLRTRGKRYYSQFGEDVFIANYFKNKTDGFYVDVGALDPVVISNTALLYERGWNGINIDPNPDSIKKFNEERPDDINLCIGISRRARKKWLYMCNKASMHTFAKDAVLKRKDNDQITYTKGRKVSVMPLVDVLDEHMKHRPDRKIHVLNIDVEGSDLAVLESNDWKRYRPHMVVIEDTDFNCAHPHTSPVFRFLTNRKYKLIAVYHITLIFVYSPRRS